MPVTADYSPSNPLVPTDSVAVWLDAMPQPIALTGGTGFVGSHLVDTLCAAGVRPRVLVRDPANPRWISDADVDRVQGDLHTEAALDSLVEGAGTVIHLAGVVRAGRESDFDRGNREGTANLVAAVCRRAPDARLVHISSLAAAGPSSDPSGRAPIDPAAPVSAYGRSKLDAERAVTELETDRRWCVLRPPAIFGPRDTDVLEFFKMAAFGVAAVPAGERWLTVAWVGDIVRAIFAAAASGRSGAIYHLGEAEPRTLVELLRSLAAAGGKSVRVIPVPAAVIAAAGGVGSALQRVGLRRVALTRDKARELVARHWTASTAASLEALGVGTPTRFVDGAALTWQWYRARGWLS